MRYQPVTIGSVFSHTDSLPSRRHSSLRRHMQTQSSISILCPIAVPLLFHYFIHRCVTLLSLDISHLSSLSNFTSEHEKHSITLILICGFVSNYSFVHEEKNTINSIMLQILIKCGIKISVNIVRIEVNYWNIGMIPKNMLEKICSYSRESHLKENWSKGILNREPWKNWNFILFFSLKNSFQKVIFRQKYK